VHYHHMLLVSIAAASAVVVVVRIVHHIVALRLQPGSGELETSVVGREDAVLLHDHRCGLLNHRIPCDDTHSAAHTSTDTTTSEANAKATAKATPNTACACR